MEHKLTIFLTDKEHNELNRIIDKSVGAQRLINFKWDLEFDFESNLYFGEFDVPTMIAVISCISKFGSTSFLKTRLEDLVELQCPDFKQTYKLYDRLSLLSC